jgi:hypothetical protein
MAFAPTPPALVDNAGELPGLALDALVPILEDQVIKARQLIVELAHGQLLPQRRY